MLTAQVPLVVLAVLVYLQVLTMFQLFALVVAVAGLEAVLAVLVERVAVEPVLRVPVRLVRPPPEAGVAVLVVPATAATAAAVSLFFE